MNNDQQTAPDPMWIGDFPAGSMVTTTTGITGRVVALDYPDLADQYVGLEDAAGVVHAVSRDNVQARHACTNPQHDHTITDPDRTGRDEPVPCRCNHCKRAAYYDHAIEDYQHDDPGAPDCFLIQRRLFATAAEGATPCDLPAAAR